MVHTRIKEFARQRKISPPGQFLFPSQIKGLKCRPANRAGDGFGYQTPVGLDESRNLGRLQTDTLIQIESAKRAGECAAESRGVRGRPDKAGLWRKLAQG